MAIARRRHLHARFYCPDLAQTGNSRLGADESRHLSRVCRLGVGDVVEIFDGKGQAVLARVVKVENNGVELLAAGPPLPERPAPFSLTLATAVPKGERFDWLVEKATELGIERLIPIMTERSVALPGSPKLERLRRAIIAASKQCRRNRLMILDPPIPWNHLAGLHPASLRFLADPHGIPPSQWPAIAPAQSVILAVGPEGGFTPAEVAAASHAGWIAISLGSTTLRIETAGLAGCAALFTRLTESGPPR